MIDKRELTKKFIDQLSLPADNKTFQKHHKLWWMNPRNSHPNSYRLTDVGFKMLVEHLEMKSYNINIPIDTILTNSLVLNLDKYMESPYFLDRKSIVVFREKTAVELILFGGDVQKYGLAKAMSQKNNTESS
jgi:hypothetical protein